MLFRSVELIQEWARARRSDPRDPLAIGAATRTELASVVEEIWKLAAASMPVEEQVTNMRECVDAASSQWLEHHRHVIVRSFSGGFDSRSRDGAFVARRPKMFELDTPGQQLTLGALAGLAPEVLKKSLETLLRANGGETGLPREERRKRLDAVFARHRVLTAEYEALREAASRLDPPVVLPELTGVAEYRFAAEVDAEAKAAREAKRQERAESLD